MHTYLFLLLFLPHGISQFNFGSISWTRVASHSGESWKDALVVKFRVACGWNASSANTAIQAAIGVPVGTPFTREGNFSFGDGTTQPWSGSECYTLGESGLGRHRLLYTECVFSHAYPAPGQYEASFVQCCRGGLDTGLMNNAGLRARVSAQVVVNAAVQYGPVASWLPIVALPVPEGQPTATQQFVALDAVGHPLRFRPSTTLEMSGFPSKSAGVADSIPPPFWSITASTGQIAWMNVTANQDGALFNTQIFVYDPVDNRSTTCDFLSAVQLLRQRCVGPAQGGGAHWLELCRGDGNCTDPGNATIPGSCAFPSVPQFLPPSPGHGSVVILYANQSGTVTLTVGRTGSHCCEAGEVLTLTNGPLPLGFQNRSSSGTNPLTVVYEWTPSEADVGVHTACWAACAQNALQPQAGTICSAPRCFGVFVSLKPNQAPQIHLPDEAATPAGVVGYSSVPRSLPGLWIVDDSGPNAIELQLAVDAGTVTLPATGGLQFLQGSGGAPAQQVQVAGAVDAINAALSALTYTGPAGLANLTVLVNDQGHSGMGLGEAWTPLTAAAALQIRVIPVCGPCPNDTAVLTQFFFALNGSGWAANGSWLQGHPCWNHWHGVLCVGAQIVRIALPTNGLSGTLPCTLGCLSRLQRLQLMDNDLSGPIPADLGRLRCLTHLSLAYNRLNGTVPAELGGLANLRSLQLNNNQLWGPVPEELGQLTNLQELLLQNNGLQGLVPRSLWQLPVVKYVWLYNNQLDETLPSWAQDRFYRESDLDRIGRENRM